MLKRDVAPVEGDDASTAGEETDGSAEGAQARRLTRLVVVFGLVIGCLAGVLALTAAPASAASSVLGAGQTLGSGQSLWSPNGAYELAMQGDGNLVLYGPGRTVHWSSRTNG